VSRRLVRAINLSIAVLLVVVLAATYRFVWRALPPLNGEIAAPVSAQATIVRDALGVPHIQAATVEDALFLQGYVTAGDRLWQMDALRRLAGGDLAEVVGKAAIEADKEARRLLLARTAEADLHSINDADRALLAAYARGVNYYIETHRGRMPLEFTLLNYDPRPWSMRDSILAGLHMFRLLTSTWRDQVEKMHMLEHGDAAKVNYLWPLRMGMDVMPGSNAWVVAGSRTASGKPILANDPHLDFAIPSTWYLVHLQAPGLNVTGASLPGVPGVIVGHNDRIAWGVTNLGYDVEDLYAEKLDPNSGRYVFRGQVEQARLEHEAIPVKGSSPVEIATWVTRHGPIYYTDGGQYYSVRWTALDTDKYEFPFVELDRSRNWDDFNNALRRFAGPGQNFVYADVDGNIGYHATGHLPIRSKCAGDVPSDGASGDCEWAGYIPFDELPQFFNPAGGIIVTANQNPFPADYNHPVGGTFAPYYRARQIRTLLDRKSSGSRPEDMLAVQKDVFSGLLYFLTGQIVKAWDSQRPQDASLKDAVDLLRGWNGQVEKTLAAPVVASLAYLEIRRAAAERAAPGSGETYEAMIAPAAIERLLTDRPAGWFEDYDKLLMRCLAQAIAAGHKIQGSKVARWDYGRYNLLRIDQPVEGHLPLIGKYFSIGPVPMSGSSTTIKQTTQRLGPSMRMIVDLGNLDGSLQNLTIGESANRLSGHYRDQWAAYYGATSFPMQFEKIDAKQTLTVNPGH